MLKFPIFIDLAQKHVLIYGGGAVALRRTKTLLQYGAEVTVIAPEFRDEFSGLQVNLQYRSYQPGERMDAMLVLAATNDPAINCAITEQARRDGILTNNASDHGDCDFYFPAVIQTDELSIGLTGTGENHGAVRDAARKIREMKL